MTPRCPHCGWPDAEPPRQVVSQHPTAAGMTMWTRCLCGSLQARIVEAGQVQVITRGRPA